MPSRFFWWWQASRVVQDTAPWGDHWEVIDEFPAFGFLLGDMHPHVLALPFVLLAVGLALNIYVLRMHGRWRDGNPYRLLAAWPTGAWETVLYALCLGGLGFLNTWDFPIYLALVAAAFGLAQWQADIARRLGPALASAACFSAGLLFGGLVCYLPFWLSLQTQASGLLPNLFNPTRLPQFFVMFGPLLVICAAFVVGRARHASVSVRRTLVAAMVLLLGIGLLAVAAAAIVFVVGRFGVTTGGYQLGYLSDWLAGERIMLPGSGRDVTQSVAERLAARPFSSWTALLLGTMVVVVAITLYRRPDPTATHGRRSTGFGGFSPADSFSVLLVGLAALLAFGVEFVYLGDVFGTRMNTVFKFYFQTWALWAIAAAYAAAVASDRTPPQPRPILRQPSRAHGVFLAVARTSIGFLVAAGLVYLPLAVAGRAAEYGGPPTLDGAAHLEGRDPADYAVIAWLNQNVAGAPVVLEATGGSYEYVGRISAHTGLPTLLGWAGHELQWRGGAEQQAGRPQAIDLVYLATDTDETIGLLDDYNVEYVVVGNLERSRYSPAGLARLETLLMPVFRSGETVVLKR